MLVLSRRIGERIVIDGNIVVTVVEIQGGKIRLGIEAPREVPVWRRNSFSLGRREGIGGGLKADTDRADGRRIVACQHGYSLPSNGRTPSTWKWTRYLLSSSLMGRS